MSFILSQAVYDGIVMAADNCLSQDFKSDDRSYSMVKSSSFRKLYVTPHNIGISYGGDSHTKDGILLTRYIMIFLDNLDCQTYKTPSQVANALLEYMRSVDSETRLQFHVCGYDITDTMKPVPQLFRVYIKENRVVAGNRELNPALIYAAVNNIPELFFGIVQKNYNNFSMQDAVDFARFMFRTVRKYMRFCFMGEAVSKNVDILAIYPHSHKWVSLKKLQ